MDKRRVTLFIIVALVTGCSAQDNGVPQPGAPSVVYASVVVLAGVECPNGGVRVDMGIDDNQNGQLDPPEIDASEYVCNGAPGSVSLVRTAPEPAGTNCATGGVLIEAGVDADDDGTLDPSEVSTSQYVCNGAQGDTGPTGPQGPAGTTSHITGTALLVGLGGQAGTWAQLVDTSFFATSSNGGLFDIPDVPDGIYTLRLTNGAYEEAVPAVIALPGGHGFLVDGSIHALDTVEFQRAHRIISSPSVTILAVSPDSQYVALCDYEGTAQVTKLLHAPTTTLRVIARTCSSLAHFKPDGTGLMVSAPSLSGTDLIFVPVLGGASQVVHSSTGATPPRYTVAPDGWRIAVQENDGAGRDSLSVIALTDFSSVFVAADASGPVFSPNGANVLFRGPSGGGDALYIGASTGGSTALLADNAIDGQFTPDGATVAFRTWSNEIRSVPVSGGPTTLLGTHGGGGYYCLSSDGTRVVFLGPGSPYSLVSVAIAGGEPTYLETTIPAQWPRPVPGGSRVLYRTAEGGWKIADAAGLSPSVSLAASPWPAVNYSGTHAAYTRSDNSNLELARLSDGVIEWSIPSELTYSLSFSPDDATLAMCSASAQLTAVAADSGISTVLLSGCSHSPVWTQMGTLLAVKSPPAAPHGYQGGLYDTHLP